MAPRGATRTKEGSLKRKVLAALAVIGLVATLVGPATADSTRRPRADRDRLEDRIQQLAPDGTHGDPSAHLPKSKKNMKFIKRVRLTDVEGGVADVNAHKGHAYVSKWSRTCRSEGGTGAGISVVDVRKPWRAHEVAFIKSDANAYQTEGVHALNLKTRRFSGDVLMVSNEPCDGEDSLGGGFSLYDISKPRKPKVLVEQFGDMDLAEFTGNRPNAIHSAFVWNDRKKGRAYVIASDNYEFEDVDIYDITNPRNPRHIAETGADFWPDEAWENTARGDWFYNHDQWVKKIGNKWYAVTSYWDMGHVILDVTNPKDPQYVSKTMWDEIDPSGFDPEGEAHQATWSKNGKWLFGTDEDFSPYRTYYEQTSGDGAGEYLSDQFGWTPQVATLPGKELTGQTIYGGFGCPGQDASEIPPAEEMTVDEGEAKILVLQRGPPGDNACDFSRKVEEAQNAGYDAVIVANHYVGAGEGATPDAVLCGSQGHAFTPEIPGICIGHRAFHLLFGNDSPTYDGTDDPAIGTLGEAVRVWSEFEGWSYIRMFDFRNPSNPVQIDTYSPAEAKSEDYAHVFPLSPHEVKTDPRARRRLVYSSYYMAGARVLKYTNKGMREVGHYIGPGGNDFWGVYPLKRGKKRPLLLFSDRSYGLYILKYNGKQ